MPLPRVRAREGARRSRWRRGQPGPITMISPRGVGGHPQPGRCLACAPVRAIGKRWVRDPVGRFRGRSRPSAATRLLYVRGVAAKSKRRKDAESGARPARPGAGQAKVFKRKSCFLCKDKLREVDYKNVNQLRRYLSERGKIRNRRMTGACRRHQRQIAVAIKRAREMALLPYVTEGGPPPSRSRSDERR